MLVGSGACPEFVVHAQTRAVAQATEEVALDGTIEMLVEDSDRGSRTLYFLISGDLRVALRFLKAPTNLTTGTPVRVHGRWNDSVLVVASFERI
jgi:hypothetical protein